eukprot:229897-Chlamydomonas_euryale.AAC.1
MQPQLLLVTRQLSPLQIPVHCTTRRSTGKRRMWASGIMQAQATHVKHAWRQLDRPCLISAAVPHDHLIKQTAAEQVPGARLPHDAEAQIADLHFISVTSDQIANYVLEEGGALTSGQCRRGISSSATRSPPSSASVAVGCPAPHCGTWQKARPHAAPSFPPLAH